MKRSVSLFFCLLLCGCVLPDPTGRSVVPPKPTGLVVVIVEDETRQEPLTSGQIIAMGAKEVDEYLNVHCVKGADDSTPEAKKYPKGADVSLQSAEVQKLHGQVVGKMNESGSKDPHLGIKAGGRVAIGPLPEGKDNMLTILKKYGGE